MGSADCPSFIISGSSIGRSSMVIGETMRSAGIPSMVLAALMCVLLDLAALPSAWAFNSDGGCSVTQYATTLCSSAPSATSGACCCVGCDEDEDGTFDDHECRCCASGEGCSTDCKDKPGGGMMADVTCDPGF